MSFNFIGKQRERADHEKSGKVAPPPSIWTEGKNGRRMLCDEPVVGGRNPLKKKGREIGYILEY